MAKNKGGLGRGMDALFGSVAESFEDNENTIQMLPIGSIDPNKEQPRKRFDLEELDQLASSIRSVGVIQPIVVTPNGKRYTIVAGERRWRAARLAELSEIPAIVRNLETVQRMEMALIENIQRTDLNPMEEAKAIRCLMQECGLKQEQVAQRVGKSRSAVANLLRLLSLPDEVAEMVSEGDLSEGHARALLGMQDESEMIRLAHFVSDHDLSVRKTEELVKKTAQAQKPSDQGDSVLAPRCAELSLVEEAARLRFGTRISIVGNEKKGRLILHYNSPEDLERIYEVLRTHED